ncbi:chromate efflux transporter [Asticcacaulis solisilvae]|uniref:chromate efflux transporter n=1 Tax=Asticcacaulis solisilvae TaxID=1217274 RepID=UPI003FD806A4
MTDAQHNKPPAAVAIGEAFGFWLKLGFISFGGPAGQISIMHQELVERKRWISEKRFLHALNYCMVLPGPEAQQLATYIGWLMHRTWGGIMAGGLFVLPSLALLIVMSWLYMAFGHLPAISGLFAGIKPAVIAIVVQAVLRIGGRALKNPILWSIACAAFIAIFAFHAPFPLIVLGAAVIGIIGGRISPQTFVTGGGHGRSDTSYGAALIDDDTPTPVHARFRWHRLATVIAAGVLLWGGPIAGLGLVLGWHHTLSEMALFFSKAALLTFGGAYAVLPYVYQGAVEKFRWISAPQMIDGLALGETTPGPLIMVVTFVGFIGGWTQAYLGPDARPVAAIIAAIVVTWFTFLPSFLFIFAGGPLIETTHNNLRFTAPLTAITAAVVGVILNLALFFSYHVIWPNGLGGTVAWPSAIIALGAAIALIRFKVNVMVVIAACGAIGLLAHSMGL